MMFCTVSEIFASFFYFVFRFSRNYVFGREKPVFPLFFDDLKFDRAENFFGGTLTSLWGIYFFSLISSINQIWEVLQNLWNSRKPKNFRGFQCFRYPAKIIRNFSKKKNIYPQLSPATYSKNFSWNGWNLWNCGGGELYVIFRPWGLQKSMKIGSGKFLPRITFALLLETHLPWKFQEFFFDRFLETLQREM